MKNFKLKFKDGKWEDENGVPIAPNDQEKVEQHIKFMDGYDPIAPLPNNWQPEIGKLYDSGDLEFELKYVDVCPIIECGENASKCVVKGKFEVCKCRTYEAWTLKEVKTVNSIRAEMPDKLKEAYNVPSLRQLCWRIDREIWAKVEVHEATQSWGREQTGLLILDFLKEIKTEEQKQIKQLQSRIAELEEQTKHLVQTMHEQAYDFQTEIDKLKSKESN